MIFFSKSKQVPESLKLRKSYREQDVIDALHKDFHNKCYICEDKAPSTINVEHFQPHKDDEDLKYDWYNLFLACGHCNNTKGHKPEFHIILNCTLQDEDPEKWIEFEIQPFPKEKAKFTPLKDDNKVKNTIQLLYAAYNGTTPIKSLESSNLRDKLIHEILDFQNYLHKYFQEETEEEDKEQCRKKILAHLKPFSAFTAFKRWIIKRNSVLHQEFHHE